VSGCCDPSGYWREFNERTARRNAEAYKRNGLDPAARRLVTHLRGEGLSGATVLEVGGGIGSVLLELLRAGAARATNVELSPEYETVATDLAREAGLADRIERRVGDFAQIAATVEPADVVVLHRVVCCYPDLDRLLGSAADRARRALALTFPRDALWTRLALPLGNAWFGLTRCPFRVFLHAPERIERIAAARGLRPAFRHTGLIWQSAVYARRRVPT
jgi:magnesium-protoporphyrin O-methyltransferase